MIAHLNLLRFIVYATRGRNDIAESRAKLGMHNTISPENRCICLWKSFIDT